MSSIREWTHVTPEIFREEIVPAAEPAVFRGLVADWPLVRAGRDSPEALCAYVKRFDRGQSVPSMMGPPGIGGRFFYNRDLSGFNFQTGNVRLGAALDFIAAHAGEERPQAFAVQSAPVRTCLPGFEAENGLPLVDRAVEPRIWIGNQVIVAAHYDQSENVACVAAGKRRFTLFPPEQVTNLYVGPFELTPAGATISMVSFEEPDLAAHPRFAEAMEAALVVELEPGDAIYIPYLWWHHVRSLDRVNMLVNYWWTPPAEGRGAPRDALVHALMSIRNLPKAHREAWRTLFDHYVFGDEAVAEHLPADRRGVLDKMDAQTVRDVRGALVRALSRG